MLSSLYALSCIYTTIKTFTSIKLLHYRKVLKSVLYLILFIIANIGPSNRIFHVQTYLVIMQSYNKKGRAEAYFEFSIVLDCIHFFKYRSFEPDFSRGDLHCHCSKILSLNLCTTCKEEPYTHFSFL